MANNNLTSAKKAKNDEFYTQYPDIQKEIGAYLMYNKDTFRGKVVYCNCDDPYESNFFKYFVLNFKHLGLKQLITTSYKPSPIANTQLSLIGDDKVIEPQKGRPKQTANKFVINEVGDYNDNGQFNLEDVAQQLKDNKNNEWAPLKGDGDFRSQECIDLLKQADIVVTNPPFSLFRPYLAQLIEYNKKLLIIGNLNAITYKEVFPLLKDNRVWLGNNAKVNGGAMFYEIPEAVANLDQVREIQTNSDGRKVYITRVHNLDHGKRYQPLQLMTTADNLKFNKKMQGKNAYDTYDNYNAIEVPFTDAIPSDHEGIMGVPISFLDKYSPKQFEIIGSYNNGTHGEEIGATKSPIEINGRVTMWNGPVVNKEPLYKRIVIQHRKADK